MELGGVPMFGDALGVFLAGPVAALLVRGAGTGTMASRRLACGRCRVSTVAQVVQPSPSSSPSQERQAGSSLQAHLASSLTHHRHRSRRLEGHADRLTLTCYGRPRPARACCWTSITSRMDEALEGMKRAQLFSGQPTTTKPYRVRTATREREC